MNRQFAELNKSFPAQVRRTKKVALDLMTVDEAIDAMEAVGHDFFVFRCGALNQFILAWTA